MLAAPSSLSATAAANGTQVNLSWADNSSNETGFKVYKSTDGTNFTLLVTPGANATSYSWTGAAPGTTYWFRVTATNAVGESAASNTATATTPAPPASPSGLSATAVSGSRVDLSWADTTATQVYTVHDLHPFLADEIVRRGAARSGLTWHYSRPPVRELEYEMDCRGVTSEHVV